MEKESSSSAIVKLSFALYERVGRCFEFNLNTNRKVSQHASSSTCSASLQVVEGSMTRNAVKVSQGVGCGRRKVKDCDASLVLGTNKMVERTRCHWHNTRAHTTL